MLRILVRLGALFSNHGLLILSGLAAMVLAELLYINSWLSANPRAWQYDFWAALVILAWAQPWRSRDRYRTDSFLLRLIVYFGLFLGAGASAYVFNRWQVGIIGAGIVGLIIFEYIGRRSIRRA